jgi:hypothetical protein
MNICDDTKFTLPGHKTFRNQCCDTCSKFIKSTSIPIASNTTEPTYAPVITQQPCINNMQDCSVNMDFSIESNKTNCCQSYKKAQTMVEQTLPVNKNPLVVKDLSICNSYDKSFCNYKIIQESCPILCRK